MAQKEKHIAKAQKYILKGSHDKAVAEYRAALDLDPRDISIRLRLGDLFVKASMKAEAIEEYSEAAKANGQRGFYLKAIAVYKQVLKLDNSILDIHKKLAELYTKQRLYADAVSEYSYILGTMEKAGKIDESIELIKKMLDIDPENVGVRIRLAETFLKAGFKEDALAEFIGAADRLAELGKTDRLEKIYLTLRQSYPDNMEVMERLCDLYRKGGSMSFSGLACMLAEKYREKGRDNDAKRLASEVVGIEPDNEVALGILGPEWTPEDAGAESPTEIPVENEAEAGEPYVETPEPEAEAVPGDDRPAEVEEEAAPAEGPAASEVEEAEPTAEDVGAPEEDFEITLEGFDEGTEAGEAAGEPEAPGGAVETEASAEAAEEPMHEKPLEEAGEPLVYIDIPGLDAEANAGEAEDAVEEEAAPEEPGEPLVDIDIPGLEDEEFEEPVAAAEETVEEEDEISIDEPGATEEVAAEAEGEAADFIEEAADEVEKLVATEEPVAEVAEPVAVEEPGVTAEAAAEVEGEAAEPIEESAPEPWEPVAVEPVAVEEPEVTEEVSVESGEEAAEAAEEPVAEEEDISMDEPEVTEEVAAEVEADDFIEEAADEVEKFVATEEPVAEVAEPVAVEEPGVTVEAEEDEKAVEAAEEPVAEEEDISMEEPVVTEEVAAEVEGEAAESIEETVAEAEKLFAEEEEVSISEPGVTAEAEEDEEAAEAVEEPIAEEEEVPVDEPEVTEEVAVEAEEETLSGISEENLAAVEELVSPVTDEDLSDAINELMEKIEPEEHMLETHPGAVIPEREPASEPVQVKEEYVDLSAELGMEEALEGLTKSWGETRETTDSLDEFKHAIGQQLTKEDSETHFNLGIAYMEMELYDEAAKEFKIALKDPRLEFECYIRLGLSAMAKGMPEEAKVYYLKGLKVRGHSEEQRLALFYELALAYEESGEDHEAGKLFMEIYSKDSGFREVASKVALYAATRPSIPLNDGMIEVELL